MSSWPRVAVVGGSLGGLTAALVLRDPTMDERRVLFECRVDSVAVFGQP